jgi:hypothetical protein
MKKKKTNWSCEGFEMTVPSRVGTYELELRDVFLPPDAPLQLWLPDCQQVIKVHDGVDERIDGTEENAVTTC